LNGSDHQSDSYEGDRYDVSVLESNILGVQYGLAHALEIQGFRFDHPYKTVILEERLVFSDSEDFGVDTP
jgi:hypothetical protein